VIAAFLAVAVLVIVVPGPDTALTVRNTLLGGRRSGLFTAAGVAGGLVVWAVATSVGLAALLASSEPVFRAVKLIGAVYLIVLGVHTLLGALRHRAAALHAAGPRLPPAAALRQGAISNLTNPKMAVFFPALLPQFASDAPSLLLLGLLFSTLTLAWLSAYALAVARAGDLLRRPRIRRPLEAATGAVLVAFGLRLAASR
jgi:threonine/homoserine/homoserine lactone efflux protein